MPVNKYSLETPAEAKARMEYETALIEIYVPEAAFMTRDQALKLAQERDAEAALNLKDSALNLEGAANVAKENRVNQILTELGY